VIKVPDSKPVSLKENTDGVSQFEKRWNLDPLQAEMYGLSVSRELPRFRINGRVPIVYSDKYNVSLSLSEATHPFDFQKRGSTFKLLCDSLDTSQGECYAPEVPSRADLEKLHSSAYLAKLQNPRILAEVMQLPALAALSQEELEEGLLLPMRLATGGTVLAARLAQEFGWSINLSGGFHHASRENPDGFCFFADIPLAVNTLLAEKRASKILIIDLDAHQGNGFARALEGCDEVSLLDVYNADIFPRDHYAASLARYNVPLTSNTTESRYLEVVQDMVSRAVRELTPDFIFYNAGVDIYKGDLLGKMQISAEAICMRDQIVFRHAFQSGAKIAMTLAGGYAKSGENSGNLSSAQIIAQSVSLIVRNLMSTSPEISA